MARLTALSEESGVRFGEGSYDVRSWKVRSDVDDHEIGRVHDVLLDDRSRTRYLDVELDAGRHVLVPSGETRVDPTDEVVRLRGLDREGASGLPEYDHRPASVTPEYARTLTTAYDSAYSDEHYYDRADYEARWAGPTDRSRAAAAGERREGGGQLARLDELDDVDIASHEPDPRGWEVVGADGVRIGRVDHVIGDTGAMKARYLTVDLDDEIHSDRRVLLPVGHVELDTDRSRVISVALSREGVSGLPPYEGGAIGRDYETELTRRYDEAYTGDRLYEHPRYRADRLDAGGAESRRGETRL